MNNTFITTKNGKPVIDKQTKIKLYTLPVELRIKRIKQQLYEGLTKSEIAWLEIQNSVKDIKKCPSDGEVLKFSPY